MSTETAPVTSPSPIKLGLSTFWYAFWTGAPIKFAIALLFMAMHVHPWKGGAFISLMLLSIPIDIWALGIVTKTTFLEKFRLVAPESVGKTLYAQIAAITLVCYFGFSFIQSFVVSIAKSITHSILSFFEPIPIAEKITLELVMWGTPASITLIILILIWLFLIGTMVKRQIPLSQPAEEDYQGLITRWDLMRVPADQPLMLTAMTGVGVLMVFLFWGLMPVTTPHPHEEYPVKKTVVKRIKPIEVLDSVKKTLAQAEATIDVIEKEKSEEDGKKGGEKAKGETAPKKAEEVPAKKG